MLHWLDAEAGEALQALSPQGREVARTWADKLCTQMERLRLSRVATVAIEKARAWEDSRYVFSAGHH